MDILYITHARIPTEKAHGINIMFTCESFYKISPGLKLIVPNISNDIKDDPYEYYNIEKSFPIIKLATISSLKLEPIIGKRAFLLQFSSFYISVLFYLLFKSRKNKVIYTRDYLVALLSLLGYNMVYECHSISYKEGLFFKLCKKFTKIVVISQGLKQNFIEHGFSEEKIFLAPDAVKLDIFDIKISKEEARQKLDLPLGQNIICYTGKFKTMGMDKGIEDILRSIRDGGLDVLFVAAGGNLKDILYYQNIAKDYNISDKVKFIGHVKQTDLANYQKAADVLLMPFPDKKHYAKFMSPIKMFEYMASQRPIVASDLPTIREVLNQENSFICKPGDPLDLAAKINKALEDKDLAKKISQQAYRDVQNYSWENRGSSIVKFIA